MSYVLLDDNFPNHPKAIRAGANGVLLHIHGLAYAKKYNTDGHIPADMLVTFSGVTDSVTTAKKLVEVGLWEVAKDGWKIHDWEDYNDSSSVVTKRRKAARARQKAHRDRKRDVTRDKGRDVTPGSQRDETPCHASYTDTDTDTDRGGCASRAEPPPTKPKREHRKHLENFDRLWSDSSDRIPPGWKPPAELDELAREIGLDPIAEAESFVAHCLSKAKESAAWPAEYKLWLRRSQKWKREREQSDKPQVSPPEIELL